MKPITELHDIDLNLPEGKLLTIAIGALMNVHPDKTPEDIIRYLNKIKDKV